MRSYHRADVKAYGCEVAGHHTEEIEAMPKSVEISTQCLLPVTTSNLGFKEGYLVQSNISSFPYLDVLMMSDITTPQSWVET